MHRRKRFPIENEAISGTSKGQKKQRSRRMDSMTLPSLDEYPNNENKWTKEALLNSKAHLDVLTQILADPNTAEGKVA